VAGSLVIDNNGNKSTINEFDTNWAYNTNNPDCVLQLVRDIHGYLLPANH
jgi:hypothetical protein